MKVISDQPWNSVEITPSSYSDGLFLRQGAHLINIPTVTVDAVIAALLQTKRDILQKPSRRIK